MQTLGIRINSVLVVFKMLTCSLARALRALAGLGPSALAGRLRRPASARQKKREKKRERERERGGRPSRCQHFECSSRQEGFGLARRHHDGLLRGPKKAAPAASCPVAGWAGRPTDSLSHSHSLRLSLTGLSFLRSPTYSRPMNFY